MDRTVISRDGYSYYLVNIDCLPNSDHFNVIMTLEDSLEELLPYLAATFPGCTYVHRAGVVNWMDQGHIVAIYPRQITITDVQDSEEAEELCRTYFAQIRAVRERRDTITPIYEKRRSMTVLDILRHLPRTNCGLCQLPTCMAFAAKVFRGEERPTACQPLVQDKKHYQALLDQLDCEGYESS